MIKLSFSPLIGKLRNGALLLGGAATLTACQVDIPPVASTPDPVSNSAVSAADPRAQAAGEAILAQGGSATDAAIAVMLALTVVEPQSSGIGGGGFMLRGTRDGTVTSYDGRETAPLAASPAWFLTEDGDLRSYRESVLTGLSIGVPGNIHMVARAHAEHGRLPWAALFEPAIKLARDGFRINRRLHQSLDGQIQRAGRTDEARALFYTENGDPKPVGTVIRIPALADTLSSIAQAGTSAFYESGYAVELANVIAADTPGGAGMTAGDIERYESKERAPVCGTYRAYRICGMGPPSSGGIAVLQILAQLERFDLNALGAENPITWHLFLESQRLAYADRALYLADSDFTSVPVNGLIDPEYTRQRSALIAPDKTIAEPQAGRPNGVDLALAPGDALPENGTSHFSVIDASGTMISYTSTIEGPFGSGLRFGGFYLNNELTDFSRSPEIDGKPVANRVEGGKRPRSSMAPTIIYHPSGEPFAAIGAAGGATIPVQTARSIIGLIDFGMSAENALALPLIMARGGGVMLEKGTWMEARSDAFKGLGHADIAARTPPLKAGVVVWDGQRYVAARDPRLEGLLETSD